MIDILNVNAPHNIDPTIALDALSQYTHIKLCALAHNDPLLEHLSQQKTPYLPYSWEPQEIMGGMQLNTTVLVFYKNPEIHRIQNIVALPNCNLQNQFVPLDVSFVLPKDYNGGKLHRLDVWAEGVEIGKIRTDDAEVLSDFSTTEQLKQAIQHKTLSHAVEGARMSQPGRKI